MDEHTRHHANPNQEGRDPDIGDSVITFTDKQAGDRSGRVERFIAAHQAWLFFPLLTLEGINLHVQSVDWLRRTGIRRYRRIELVLLSVHVLAYLSVVLLVLSPVKALCFVAIQQAVWGVYMGCSFAPNHKGMPMLGPDDTLDFLRRQVVTSRNIRGGRFTDLLLGGLNYQVEHHLFPNMPRDNLRKAQPIVRAHCRDLAVPYTETGSVPLVRHRDRATCTPSEPRCAGAARAARWPLRQWADPLGGIPRAPHPLQWTYGTSPSLARTSRPWGC